MTYLNRAEEQGAVPLPPTAGSRPTAQHKDIIEEATNVPSPTGPSHPVEESTAAPIIQTYALHLKGVRFHGTVGVSVEERSITQEIVVDVDLDFLPDALPQIDLVNDGIDYDSAVRRVVEEGLTTSYTLLETYARRVLGRLLAEMPVVKVRVAVTKGKVPTTYPVDEAVVEVIGLRRL